MADFLFLEMQVLAGVTCLCPESRASLTIHPGVEYMSIDYGALMYFATIGSDDGHDGNTFPQPT